MALVPLPSQPPGVAWPTVEWPTGSPAVDEQRLDAVLDEVFTEAGRATYGETKALLVVQNGRVVCERYGEGVDATTTLPSWSLAKTMVHAVFGLLVRDAKVDLDDRAAVAQWRDPSDPRHEITYDVLLRMSSGLGWNEDYVDDGVSDVITMLYGDGKGDMAAYAASKPLVAAPDTTCVYSSGTSVILSRLAADALDVDADGFAVYLRSELFDLIGMASATPKFDAAGTWIGSTYCFATARDFARLGLLYLRDGVWDTRRLLPEGWVDYGRTVSPTSADRDYGAHWMLVPGDEAGTFYHSGYNSQYLVLAPALDLVVVRLGVTPLELKQNVFSWVLGLVRLFDPPTTSS